jgi:hypothetical protein
MLSEPSGDISKVLEYGRKDRVGQVTQLKNELGVEKGIRLPEPAVKKTARDRADLYWIAWGMTLKDGSPDPTKCEHQFAHIGPMGLGAVGVACMQCGWLEKWGDAVAWQSQQ